MNTLATAYPVSTSSTDETRFDVQVLLPDSPIPTAPKEAPHEVVFVDGSLADHKTLIDAVRPGVEVVVIAGGSSGLKQMADWATTHSGYDSIAIVGHGAEGMQRIGADSLSETTLANEEQRSLLQQIGGALKPDGDILLYGCDVAEGEIGQQFVRDFAAVTGADVAASEDITGHSGNWNLEYSAGIVTTDGPFTADVNQYTGDLAGVNRFYFGAGNKNAISYYDASNTIQAYTTGFWEYANDGQSLNSNQNGITFTWNGYWQSTDNTQRYNLTANYTYYTPSNYTQSQQVSGGVGTFQLVLPGNVLYDFHPDRNGTFLLNSVNVNRTDGSRIPYGADGQLELNGGSWISSGFASPFPDNSSLSVVINTAPTFLTGSSKALSYSTTTTTAQDITSYLHVSDTDKNQTETWTITTSPSHGTVSIGSASATSTTASSGAADITPADTFTYTPTGGYSGTDTFSVQISDGKKSSTLTFNVLFNDPPVVTAGGTTAYTEQTPLAVASGITISDTADSEWNGGTLAVSISANSEASDKLFLPTTASADIWLNTSGNQLMSGTTQIGTASTAQVTGNTTWTFTFNSAATNVLVQNTAQAVRYDNSSDAPSTASRTVTFTATDKNNASTSVASATQTLTITPVNDAPTGVNDTATAVEASGTANATVGTNPTGNVLTNDTDPDSGDSKTVSTLGFGSTAGTVGTALAGAYGSLMVKTDGSYTYTVDNANTTVEALRTSSDTLTDTFSYTVKDSGGLTSTASLTVTIQGANDAPVGVNDTATAVEAGGTANATAGTDPTGNVLSNDTDVDSGDSKAVSAVSFGTTAGTIGSALTGQYGSLNLKADGSYTYTLNNGNSTVAALRTSTDTLSDTFSYTVKDSAGLTSTASLSVTVQGANDAPVGVNDTATAVEAGGTANGTTGTDPTGNVLTNDTDVDAGDTKTVSALTGGTVGTALAGKYGSLNLKADGSYTYSVDNANATVNALRTSANTLTDTFTYTVKDGGGLTSTANLTVTVQGANDAPAGVNDTATAVEAGGSANATAGTDPTGNVLTNDTDVDTGDTKTVSALTGGTLGTALAGQYGSLNLKADGSYAYTVDNANSTVQALLLATDTVTDTFTYTVKDTAGLTSTATLTVTVQGANDTPIGVNDTATAVEAGGSLNATAGTDPTGNVLTNDTDVDAGDTKTVSALTGGTVGTALAGKYGSLTLNTDGTYTYAVDNASSTVQALRLNTDTLTDTFTYTMKDTGGLTSTATLTVTVQGADDAPVAINDAATVIEAGGTANATVGINPTGNVLTNDTDVDTGDTKTVSALTDGTLGTASAGQYGSLTLNVDGSYSYALDDSNSAVQALRSNTETLTDTYTYTVQDTAGLTHTATLSITVQGSNDAPVAVDDSATAVEAGGTTNAALGIDPTGNVLSNDTDVDAGDTKTVSALTGGTVGTALVGAYGSLTLNADGSYVYVVDNSLDSVQALRGTANTLSETFGYTVMDAAGLTSTATLTVTVQGADDAPTGFDNATTAIEAGGTANATAGTTANGDVLGNDTDVDSGDSKTVSAVAGGVVGTALAGQYGSLTLNTDGSYSYVIDDANSTVQALRLNTDTLTDTFTYTVQDTAGLTSTAALSITVQGANDAPVAANDSTTAVEAGGTANATAGSTASGNVLANDTDVDAGDSKTVSALTGGTVGTALAGTYGSLTLNTDGSYSYVVDDANSTVQALRLATDTVTDTFTYTVQDTAGLTSTATLTVTVQGADDAPVASSDTATAIEAGGTANATTGSTANGNVLANDTDVDAGDSQTVSALTGGTVGTALAGTYGSLTLNTDGSYSYVVDDANSTVQALRLATDTVTDTFTYTVQDTAGLTSTATLTVTVQGADDAPVASSDTATAVEAGGTANATAGSTATGNVLANDTDVDAGDSQTVSAVAGGTVGTALAGTYGSLTLNTDGSYSYVVDDANSTVQALRLATDTITDTFTYTVQDTAGLTSTATLTVTVQGADDAPVASSDTATAIEAGGTANATTGSTANGNVLANDTDVDAGDSQTVSAVAGGTVGTALVGTYGSLTLNTDGSYSYVVDNANSTVQALRLATDTVTDTFTYTVQDTAGLTSTATLTVTVQGADDAPVASNDTATAIEAGGTANATAGSTATGNVLANDTDVDAGDSQTVSALTSGTVGTALAGQYGSLTLNADGSYSYVVDDANSTVQALRLATDTVTDTFTYTVKDTAGLTHTASLTVTVQGADDAPVASSDTATAVEAGGTANATAGSTATGNVLANDTDVDTGDSKTVSALTGGTVGTALAGQYGNLTLNADGSYSYVVDNANSTVQALRLATDTVSDTFTYTVQDTAGLTSTASLTVTVQGADDAPVASSDTATATAGSTATGNVLANDTDVDTGDSKTVSALTSGTVGTALAGQYGSLTLNNDGSYSYVVDNANSTVQALRLNTDTLTDTFTYTVQDTAGLTSTASLTVTVQGTDDAPVASNDTAIALASGATPGIDPTGNVLTNDTDIDHGDNLRVTGLTGQAIQGQYGSLTLNADGHYVYTLDNTLAGVQNLGGTNQTLTDHFTYTVSDQADKTATAALDITVQGASRFPTEQTRQTVLLDQFSEFKSAALNQSVVSLSEPLAAGTADVAMVVSAVPTTGQLTLDNGTPVTVGMSLNSTQLAALQYLSVPGFNGSAGALVYQASTNKADAVRTVELNIKPVSYFSISSGEASVLEGSTRGKTQYAFNVQRGGDLSQVTTVSWQVDTGGSADASDFVGNTLPSGTFQFAAGDSTHTLNLPILADRVVENTETFTVRLTQINPAASATGLEIQTPVPAAQGTILDDDDTARILSVQAVGANGGTAPTQYATGDSLLFDVTFSRPVTAAVGTTLVLTLDTRDASGVLVPTTRLATLISGSGTTTLHFAYVVQTEDADASGIALGGSLQGGGVVDTAGNAVSLDFTPSTLTGMEVNVNRGTGPAGATLYADANGNGQFDPGEVSTVVDAQGRYELVGGNGPLQVLSADSDALPLSAPAGASVVNPLTTLLADMAGGNTNPSTLENLQTALKTALGLADSVDLLHDNAVNQTTQSLAPIDSIVTGLKTYAAWAKISDLIYLGGNILTQSATGPLSPHQAGQAVITALSDYITAHPGETLDLTDSSLVATLIRNAATLRSDVDGVKVETLLTGTVSVLTSSNQQLDAAATATNAAEAYDQLVVMAKIQTLAKAYDLKALAQNALSGVDPGTVAPIRLEIAAQTPDQSEGSSGTTPYIFTVTRNGNPELPLTVDYAVSGSVDTADFGGTLPAGTLSFGAGEVIKPFIVSVSGDVLEEPSETFTVSLHNASIPVSFNIQSADSLIRNDDPPTLEIHQPGLVSSIAGTATPIPGVSIGDGDRGNITLSVTLAPEKGQVTATGPAAISRDGDSLVLSGSFDNINTTLQSLAFTVDPGELAGKLLITTNDGDPTTDDPTSKLTVDGLYVTTIQLPDNPKVLAGGTTPVTGLSIADEENGRRGVLVTLTLTPTQGGITLTPYGGTTLTPQANGAVQLDGLVNDLNHTLSTLAFKADPQVSRATLHIDSDDHFDLTPNTSTTLNLAVLSSPTQSVPKGAVAVVNGVASAIAGLKVADYDSGRLQVTLTATGGTLELPQQTGVTVTSVDTHTWQLSGRPIDLNNSLAALRYTADLNLGSGTLRLATTDLDTLTQTARNDIKLVYQAAPTETLPTAITVLANTPTAVTGVQVADTDSATLTVTLNPTGGQIAIAESTGVTQARNDAGTVTLTGDINALNRALDTLSVTGQPGYFQVDVRVADNQPLTPDAVGTLNIAVLDSPHLILPSSTTVSSSTLTGVPGLQVVDGDSSAVTLLLAPTRGNLNLPDASGITINPLTDGGLSLSGAPNALNNALFDLSFKATPGATDARIDVTADDGDARTQNSTATVALSVAPERPPAAGGDLTLLALNGQAVLEDSIPTVANIRLAPTTLSDPDGGAPNRLVILNMVGGTLTQADGSPLLLGTDGTVLSLDHGSLDLRFQPTAGRIEAATFRYALVDNVLDGLHSAVSQVTLPLTPINHAPVAAAALTDQTGIETVAFSYTVPTEAFKDSDAGDTLTLSAGLAGGQSLPDWLHFDPSTAQFSGTPDKTQAGNYPIQITATDAAGLSVHSAFNLVIADFIEPPTVELPPGLDTGEGANDGVTNQKVFSLQGKTQPGAQLVVLDPDHSTLDRVTADEAGAWQVLNIDTSTLVNDQGQRGQDGDYTFTVELLAEDQSVAAEKSFTLTIDTQAPTAPLGIHLTGAINTVGVPITNDSTPSFDITLANDPAADIKPGYVMKLISQDANGQESTVANTPLTAEDIAAGTINVTTLELADGTYSLVARLYDTAGNYQGELPLAFTIQTDQDGVLPSVESLVEGGDFNGDGIPDATQAQVTTFPMRTAEDFNAGIAAPPASFGSLIAGDLVTNTGEASGIASASIAIDPNAQLIGVKVLTPQDVENRYQPDVAAAINTALAGITVDPVMSGILDFTVQNKTGEAPLIDLDPSRPGLQTRVIIELPEGVKAHTYYKIGATFDNPTPHVYAYMADGNLSTFDDGAELFDQNGDGFIDRVVVTFTDGGGGDDDLTANGQIVDPGFLGIETDAAQPGITLSGNTDPTQSPDDNLEGTEGSDTLQGLMGADTLSGRAGNDSLLGGEGHDALYGGDGDDTLDGGHGSDTRLDGEAGQDSILGDLGDDWLYGGDGNDTLDGGDGRDKLFGEDGDDLIRGGAKRDRMTGGAGNDTLEGGKGRDVYLYAAKALGEDDLSPGTHDFIREIDARNLVRFSPEVRDVIKLDGQALSSLKQDMPLGDTLDADHSIAYSTEQSSLLLDLDGNGVFEADQDVRIELSGVTQVRYEPDVAAFILIGG